MLGWGGFWFWDPVENASLLPWLTATAFLHSIQIQENRGMLKVWNMGLVTLTFLLTIFATFLTRSGLIESVHTFAENTKIAFIFLAFMGVMAGCSALLIAWRYPQLKSENQIQSVSVPRIGIPLQQPDPIGCGVQHPVGDAFPGSSPRV